MLNRKAGAGIFMAFSVNKRVFKSFLFFGLLLAISNCVAQSGIQSFLKPSDTLNSNRKNLVFLSTMASVATLIGLLGTVIGMITSFSALGEEGGAGAASNLAVGISEALYNTAIGIGTSSLALVMYNIFTTKIDSITYGIDESGFTLTQSFASQYK